MTEIRKAPDGWVGFHPDDPARLETFAKWLDMLDEWCATQDGEYAPSDEIQLDARRIAEAIRSHLPESDSERADRIANALSLSRVHATKGQQRRLWSTTPRRPLRWVAAKAKRRQGGRR